MTAARRWFYPASLVAAALVATAAIPVGSIVSSAPAHAVSAPASVSQKTFTASGVSSTYSIYANGVDPSQAVGAMYYFGGDYWNRAESEVANSRSSTVQGLAKVAASKNMILVIPTSPDTDARGDGITWWEDIDRNGAWFRALRANLDATYNLDESRTWLVGYSGGAEFISYEVLTDHQDWIRGGGATMIGGGGAESGSVRFTTAPTAANKALSLQWHAGSKDVIGDTNPPEFSAIGAAREGRSAYQKAGFTKTGLNVIPGADHYHYDYPGLVARDVAALPDTKPSAPSEGGYTVAGGIKARYNAMGGAAVLGKPTSPELPAGSGNGVYQTFSASGWRIYWSKAGGAVAINTNTPIGARFAATGFSAGWGSPKFEQRALPGGHSYQDFRTSSGAVIRAMDGPSGVHTVNLSSPIGAAWAAAGHEHGWGFPISETYRRNGGTLQDFSAHRYAYENPRTHAVGVYYW